MANNYWIKLYIEILDDPKMGRLTAEQWRLAIELFLLAGEQNKNGILPSLPDMAWRLRIDENELLQTMSELEQVGILSQDGDAWIVTNFARRQDKISDAERSKAWRRNELIRNNIMAQMITKQKLRAQQMILINVEMTIRKRNETATKTTRPVS